MADDRFDPEPVADNASPRVTAEDAACGERWLAENHDWVKARVQEALDDPRPAISLEEAELRAEQRYAVMRAKYGR